ncbi:MAG: NADH-quinone oxidoreductase subunit C [Gemmatales bacterium]|nr:MAG: NADH-quinone oxidoreductase subunit C [Gemmatales bacterium]
MTSAEIIARLEEKFGDRIREKNTDAIDPYVVVDPIDLVDVCRFMKEDEQLSFEMLNCITSVDYFEPDPKKAPKAGFEPHLEVVYHLSSLSKNHRFVLKVMLPRWKADQPGELPELPSVHSIWPGADWHEREVYDLGGVWFTDHPNLTRILLSEDWVGHPLRKDYEFPLEYHGIRGR